jgi:D-3-phosphoglycerate dehydrogenase
VDQVFRVGVTRDFLKPDGSAGFGDIGLMRLTAANLRWEYLAGHASELQPEEVAGYDGLLLLGPRVTAATLEGEPRLKIVARFGVGYDNVDVPACTNQGVLLTITPDGVRRPVAVAALTFVLALAGKLLTKDRLARQGRWHEKLEHMGMGLTGRTLGVIGLGNIGREVFHLAAPLQMRHVGHDPHVAPAVAAEHGIAWLPLEQLLQESDFVCICCNLTASTHHLIDARRIALMRASAYLINVARGPIVDQAALTAALRERRIAGAGLDVFEREPVDPSDPLLSLDNVVLSPHALCWTDECLAGNGHAACQSIVDVASGRLPRNLINREALAHRRWSSVPLQTAAV